MDRNRIGQILADPIANQAIASLLKTDIASYRDDRIQRGWQKYIDLAAEQLADFPENRKRITNLNSLRNLWRQSEETEDYDEKLRLQAKVDTVQQRENIKKPARTTITNKLKLITRALNFIGATLDIFPDLAGAASRPITQTPTSAGDAARKKALASNELAWTFSAPTDSVPARADRRRCAWRRRQELNRAVANAVTCDEGKAQAESVRRRRGAVAQA
jgi:hypothetical protein